MGNMQLTKPQRQRQRERPNKSFKAEEWPCTCVIIFFAHFFAFSVQKQREMKSEDHGQS